MARQLNDALELEEENDTYRETLYVLKAEIVRIRNEYFLGAVELNEMAVSEVDEELETVSLTIENALF
jgi:hypothetical protein